MSDTENEMIEITKIEYDELNSRDKWLTCLENSGVDNWNGMEVAQEMWEEWDND